MASQSVNLGKSISRIAKKLREEGLATILSRRLNWYQSMLYINNRTVGRMVELLGNRVSMDGCKFSVNSPSIITPHKSTLFFGFHELDERKLLKRHLPRDLPIVEFGGGLGVISCLANRRIDQPKRHVVIEANPGLISMIEGNRELNGCGFTVINKALAYGSPTIELCVKSNFVGSGLNVDGDDKVSVPTTTMRATADAAGFDEFAVICDIEGMEKELVDQEIECFRERVRFILVEVHPGQIGKEAVESMISKLKDVGFAVIEECGDNLALSRN